MAKLAPVEVQPGRRVLTPRQQRALDDLVEFALNHEVPTGAEPAKFDREELYLERFTKPAP